MKSETVKTGLCQVCNKTKKMSELMPVMSIRNSLVELVKNDGNQLDLSGFICTEDLNKLRGRYVEKILEEEKGQLSSFDKEVLESIINKDLLSKNVTQDFDEKLTLGERLSDKIAQFGGSWIFISLFGFFLIVWMIINVVVITVHPFDPYPFILLNLILSCIAAIQAPIIMMSQNRQEDKDRKRATHDYQVNLKAEIEIRQINDKIDHLMMQQGQKMLEIQEIQIELMEEISNKLKK
jgi:uncharacterized membrane protein